ncbi:MAG: hypothetical protein JSW07_10265, partial [bacterium]
MKYLFVNILLEQWRERENEILKLAKKGYRLKVNGLGLNTENVEQLIHAEDESTETVIGEID